MRNRVVLGFGVSIIGLYLTFIASGMCLAQQCVDDCDGSGPEIAPASPSVTATPTRTLPAVPTHRWTPLRLPTSDCCLATPTATSTASPTEYFTSCCQLPNSCYRPIPMPYTFCRFNGGGYDYGEPYSCNEETGRCEVPTVPTITPSPTPTPSASCTPGGLNLPPGCRPEGPPPVTPTRRCVGKPPPACSPGELVCRDPLCHADCSCATRTPTPTVGVCVGDCNGDGEVRINELILGVNIALGNAAVSACASFCPQPLGGVYINCAVEAVNNALVGCGTAPASPTVTATPSRTCAPPPLQPTCAPGEGVVCDSGQCGLCRCATITPTTHTPAPTCTISTTRTVTLTPSVTPTPSATRTCPVASPPPTCPAGEVIACADQLCSIDCGCGTVTATPTQSSTPSPTDGATATWTVTACNHDPTTTPTQVPPACEGCNDGDVCTDVISGVTYTGTCGDGQIIGDTCYRSCDWAIPPDVCGGDACNSGSSCLTMWHGLVVGGSCHQCTCIFNPGTPTSTSTPTPTGQIPITPTRTVPPALEHAISFICGGREYERTFAADGDQFSGACYGFEHFYRASMRQFGTPADALQALDADRPRGTAVPFRGGEAVSWSELDNPERYDNYVWARGCWFVHVLAAKNLGSPRSVGPLGLAEAIYAFGTEDGLFDMCLPPPTPSPRPTTGCEEACGGRFCVTEGGVTGNCLPTDDSGQCRCVLEVTPTTPASSPSIATSTPTRPPGPTATLSQ